MNEALTTYAWYSAIVAVIFCFVYWLADKLIDMALPPDEEQARQDMEKLLAAANKEVINRPRVRAGIFNNWRKS